MKHLLLFGLLLAASPVAAQQVITPDMYIPSIPALDDKDGFRDIKFGTELSHISAMERVSANDELYRRASDNLSIGEAKLASITYAFHNGIFYGVYIKIKGEGNSFMALQALKSAYGDPYQGNEFIPSYRWSGRTAVMSYEENMVSHDTELFTYNKALLRQVVADEKEKAKPKNGDL